MILIIDTADKNKISLLVEKDGKKIAGKTIKTDRNQSEKLLISIDKLLGSNNFKLSQIKGIKVAHQGSSFTSLRIGVLTANALAYALGLRVEPVEKSGKFLKKLRDFNIVVPDYKREINFKEIK